MLVAWSRGRPARPVAGPVVGWSVGRSVARWEMLANTFSVSARSLPGFSYRLSRVLTLARPEPMKANPIRCSQGN